jgi:hypothetical protein
MPWIDFLGFAATLGVLASFSMSTILALRTLALLSNVLFILAQTYGFSLIPLTFEKIHIWHFHRAKRI